MSSFAVGTEAFANVREIAFGRVRVRPAERKLLVDDCAVRLGGRAFELLLALIERRDRTASKNELLDVVWPGLVVEENNLQQQIRVLRKLLGPDVIVTIPGRGYRFAAELQGAHSHMPAPPTPSPAMFRAPRYSPNNLPQAPRKLIGRDDELGALTAMVKAHSLTTVIGAGGIGKTTVALAAGDALRDHWRDGVWVVEMARIAEREEVPRAVARALGLSLGTATSVQDQLIDVLRTQSLLLILDNCEHLIDAVGRLAEGLVAGVPGVHVLTTSQELLNVRGERLLRLNPLAVPAPDADLRIASSYGASRLFEERAQAVDPQFAIDPTNASAVVEICRQLDGLPLAIELAAARVRLVGVHGLRDRLGEMFHLLTGGARTAPPRHQTLRAALEWSHGLLSVDEQVVLRRLSVFVGGFTLELAQQVACGEQLDEWAVLDALGGLVDKSLVVVTATGEPPRYRLLEPTRIYAVERLAASGETAVWVERHAQIIRSLFVETEESRFGEVGSLPLADYMQRLTPELDNLRTAFVWAMGPAGDLTIAVELAATSSEVYRLQGLSREALDRMHALSAHVDTMHNSPMAALFLSQMCATGNQGRMPVNVMLGSGERAEAIYRRLGYRRRLYRTLYVRAWALNMLGRGTEAEAILPELEALEAPDWPAFVLSQRLNLHGVIFNYTGGRSEQSVELFMTQRRFLEKEAGEAGLLFRCLTNLCLVLLCLGRDDEVVSVASSVMNRMGGDRNGVTTTISVHLTQALAFLGRLEEADQVMQQSMAVWRRDRMLPYYCGALTVLLARAGRVADAIRLQGASTAFIARNGLAKNPVDERMADELAHAVNSVGVSASEVATFRREGELLDEPAIAALCLRTA